MIFYNVAICSLTKSHKFRNIFLKLRISHFTGVASVIDELRNTERKLISDKVLSEKSRTFSNPCSRFFSNNDVEEKRISWSGGICDRVVKSSGPLQPYLRLIRLDNPTGCWLLFWPFGWSIALTADPGCLPDLHCLLTFYLMAVIMRGAGCTINDMWDKEIDQKVARTKNRPLAKEELTRFDALVFLGGQLGLGCLILLQYNFYTVILSASSLVLAISYPLMKKLIPYPQVILGMAMNYGTLLGSPAVYGFSDWSVCLPLYLGGICWTVVYDTIYAYQDINDDKKLGLKSTAITFNDNPKLWLGGFSGGMISLMSICGIMNEQTWPFYTSLLLISAHLAKQIYNLNTDNVRECASKFVSNQRIGLILFLGIVLGSLLKSKSVEKNSSQASSQKLVTET